jgi:acyl carrier protein
MSIEDRVRKVLLEASGLGESVLLLTPEDDLWEAGLESLASVRVMVAIEEDCAIEFPEDMLTRSTFASIRSITRSVEMLLPSPKGDHA